MNHGRNFTPLAVGISRLASEGPMAYTPLLAEGTPDLSQDKNRNTFWGKLKKLTVNHLQNTQIF